MTPGNELDRLQSSSLQAGVGILTFLQGLSTHFWTVDALVCMGGYNTLVEAVSRGAPTVCVPRTKPRAEQLLRAQAFEQLGLLRTIRPDQLSPERLRDEIDRALQTPRQTLLERANAQLRFDGARQAATHLLALAGHREVAQEAEADVANAI